MTQQFMTEPSNLKALLQVADVDDLDILVDYLTDKGEGRLSLDEEVCARLVRCQKNKQYSESDRKVIANEICLFGGNTLVNIFRGSGVSYAEVARDVASHLKASFSDNADVTMIESGIAHKLFSDALAKMSDADRLKMMEEMKIGSLSSMGPAAAATLMGGATLAGFATYQISLIVANSVARAMLGKGLSFAANAGLTRGLGLMLGPIGWVITGLWTVADFASPAYRVTVPCVVQIAYIRQKALTKSTGSTCKACGAMNAVSAKFCGECGLPQSAAA